MNIREFIDKTKEEHHNYLRNRAASEVLLGPPLDIHWGATLKGAGYIRVDATGNPSEWNELHQWCMSNFGQDHYTWTGNIFWFENELDAVTFALRWA